MLNKEVLSLNESLPTLKSIKSFKIAKAVILNMKKIEDELISVTREMIKDKSPEESETIIKDVLSKESEIVFITLSDEDMPEDISVEQYSILYNFIK